MRNWFQIFSVILIFISLSACDISGVKSDVENPVGAKSDTISKVYVLDQTGRVESYDNGVKIKWHQSGTGKQITDGEVVNIDYEVRLEDSSLVESTRSRGMASIPFMVGFTMQTAGWDYALKKLKEGDSVEIFLPSKLARGEKGYRERDKETGEIRELIPANANLILVLKAKEIVVPTRTVDGNKVWMIFEQGESDLIFGENTQVDFHCTVSTKSNVNYVNTFNNKPPFSMKLGDNGVVPGLKKSLLGSKKGDRMYILVPSSEAYKNKGLQDLVKPNEDLFYNALVMDVRRN